MEDPFDQPRISPDDQIRCQAIGGTIRQVLMHGYACVYPASDTGQSCNDSTECEGFCMTEDHVQANTRTQGRCSALVNGSSTGNRVVSGRATSYMIVD